MDPGGARLGKKMDQLVEYTSLLPGLMMHFTYISRSHAKIWSRSKTLSNISRLQNFGNQDLINQ